MPLNCQQGRRDFSRRSAMHGAGRMPCDLALVRFDCRMCVVDLAATDVSKLHRKIYFIYS